MIADLYALLRRPGTVLLEAAGTATRPGRGLLFADPQELLVARTPGEVVPLLEALDTEVGRGRFVAGYLGYEAGLAFEEIAPAPGGARPLAWFGVYDAPHVLAQQALDALVETAAGEPLALENLRLEADRPTYLARVEAVRQHIREGDVYQVNLTDRVRFDVGGSPRALYRALRQRQRVPFGAYLDLGDFQILSRSPELFFRRAGDRITTRPMKGTVRRGRTLAEDAALQRWLAADAKNRAENLMIVDLLRNDLARCCVPGSVEVPALFTTEPYETLIQMTSTVEGRLRPDVRYADIFRALFPCGSITGAPKIRAMEIIHALEGGPRGVYCGAIGYAGPDAEASFSVAIRTAVVEGGRGVMGIGSGIVWESEAAAEYDESRLKARFLAEAVPAAPPPSLIETMRAAGGAVALLDLHADRLAASARYFDYPFDAAHFRQQVGAAAAALPPDQAFKVRAVLDSTGRLALTTHALPRPSPRYRSVTFAEERVDSGDRWLYHKTTRRAVYERAYARARAEGFDEALLVNERGEVTEGTRTNVFVRIGARLCTPPLESGLLGGVYRRHLLATHPEAEERVLYPADLLAADAVYLCNAIHGLIEVDALATPPGHSAEETLRHAAAPSA